MGFLQQFTCKSRPTLFPEPYPYGQFTACLSTFNEEAPSQPRKGLFTIGWELWRGCNIAPALLAVLLKRIGKGVGLTMFASRELQAWGSGNGITILIDGSYSLAGC